MGLLLLSCTHFAVGDSALRVRGEIRVDQQTPSSCTLELRLAKSDQALATEVVPAVFFKMFFIGPQRQSYYVMIRCSGYQSVYNSKVFTAQGMQRYHNPVDLGVIRLSSGV